jgi:hypothetical protein
LASVELGGGEGAIQISGNIGLAVIPIYICTLKPPFCICPLFVSAFPVSISSRSLYLPPLIISVKDSDPLETYPNQGGQEYPQK